MPHMEIWPEGDIEVSTAVIDGESYLRLHMVDGEGRGSVVIGFRLDHFVAVTDQWTSVADAMVDKRAKRGG